MHKLAQVISKMGELDKFLSELTEMCVQIFRVRWATVSILDEASGLYTIKATAQREEERQQQECPARIEEAEPWLSQRQKILKQRLLEEMGTRMSAELKNLLDRADTFVSMPLFVQERLIGVLNLGGRAGRELFNQEELQLLTELSSLLAPLVYQAMQYHNLGEQRRHQQHLLNNLVCGIVAVEPQEKITVFNRAAERILHVEAQEVLGKHMRILPANLAQLLRETLHQGKSYRREELFIQPENVWLGVSTSQFYDARGRLSGACMVFTDLSPIKRTQELSRQESLNTYWSNVANSLAHEVKNSIVATKVFTEMFPQKYEDAEFRWSLYATLKRDMQRLDEFTQRILDFAQPQDLCLQLCELDKVMEAAINAALTERDVGEISFEKRYSPHLGPLPADYHRLKQAFAQIVSNALEAMGKQGKLSITIEKEQSPAMLIYDLPEVMEELPETELVVVKITDTGCGIQPKDLPRLFDPFFTTKEARCGLGLACARKIVQAHQGVIAVKSKPGAGTTFWVCLPVRK